MRQKHTHRLRRHTYKTGTQVYFCILPDCTFKIECVLSLGKNSICNICGEEFIINEYTIKLAKPHCEKCSKIKVRGADGRKHFIRRDSLPVMASLAQDNTESLRERLDNITTLDSEKDI